MLFKKYSTNKKSLNYSIQFQRHQKILVLTMIWQIFESNNYLLIIRMHEDA